MRSRLIIIVVAVVLGLTAAFAAMRYLQAEQARVAQGAQLVTVLVAQQDLPTGMTTDQLIAKGYLTQRQIPRQYVAASAISSSAMLDGKVVAQPISKDQQVTTGMFKYASDVGLASSTPKDYLAISVPYDAPRGVGGLVKPGDSVGVYATFEGSDGVQSAVTKLVLPKAKVLAVNQTLATSSTQPQSTTTASNSSPLAAGGSSQQSQPTAIPTVTLALTAADAEKLVFAQEEGKIWLALYAPTDPNTPVTTGVRYGQVVR